MDTQDTTKLYKVDSYPTTFASLYDVNGKTLSQDEYELIWAMAIGESIIIGFVTIMREA